MRVCKPCVPGQPGCVLRNNSVFAVPVEERLAPGHQPALAPEPSNPSCDGPAG